MELYKDRNNVFWLLTDNGWWSYHTMSGADGAHQWCWNGVEYPCSSGGRAASKVYPELSPSTPLEFLVLTGKNIDGMKMITIVDGGRVYRYEVIKLK